MLEVAYGCLMVRTLVAQQAQCSGNRAIVSATGGMREGKAIFLDKPSLVGGLIASLLTAHSFPPFLVDAQHATGHSLAILGEHLKGLSSRGKGRGLARLILKSLTIPRLVRNMMKKTTTISWYWKEESGN